MSTFVCFNQKYTTLPVSFDSNELSISLCVFTAFLKLIGDSLYKEFPSKTSIIFLISFLKSSGLVLGNNFKCSLSFIEYFTASLLSKTASDYAAMSGESIIYEDREITPKYHVGIGYDKYNNNINASLYLGRPERSSPLRIPV